jgi:hypothetical protein
MPAPFETHERRGIALLVGSAAGRCASSRSARARGALCATSRSIRCASSRSDRASTSRRSSGRRAAASTARFLEHCLQDQSPPRRRATTSPTEEGARSLRRRCGRRSTVRSCIPCTPRDRSGARGRSARSGGGGVPGRLGRDLALPEPDASRLLDEGTDRARQRFSRARSRTTTCWSRRARARSSSTACRRRRSSRRSPRRSKRRRARFRSSRDFEVTQIRGRSRSRPHRALGGHRARAVPAPK